MNLRIMSTTVLISSACFFCSWAASLLLLWHTYTRKRHFKREARELQACNQTLNNDIHLLRERLATFQSTQERTEHHIKSLCAGALEQSSQHLLQHAEALFEKFHLSTQGKFGQQQESLVRLMTPVQETLSAMNEHVRALEQSRAGAYEGLHTEIKNMAKENAALQTQTARLAGALGTPNMRGRWGEIQLRRLVESAGMLPFCDFAEQTTLTKEDGTSQRPDLIIRMPEHKTIVVDAKVPMDVLLHTEASTQDARKQHAKKLKQHIAALSQKNYAETQKTPAFVLLFLPTESLLISALEADASLLDYSADKHVLVTTPMSLLALLKTIALGWQHTTLSENVQHIDTLAKALSTAVYGLSGAMLDLEKGLRKAVDGYNTLTRRFEQKVTPQLTALQNATGTTAPANQQLKTLLPPAAHVDAQETINQSHEKHA